MKTVRYSNLLVTNATKTKGKFKKKSKKSFNLLLTNNKHTQQSTRKFTNTDKIKPIDNSKTLQECNVFKVCVPVYIFLIG